MRLLSFALPHFPEAFEHTTILCPEDSVEPLSHLLEQCGVTLGGGVEVIGSGLPASDPNEVDLRFEKARNLPVDAWLAVRADHIRKAAIPGPWVSFFADFLLFDYPFQFSRDDYAAAYGEVLAYIGGAQSLISFSKYVADKHLVEGFGIDPSKSNVVPHAPIDYLAEIKNSNLPGSSSILSVDRFSKRVAARYLRSWLRGLGDIPHLERATKFQFSLDGIGIDQLEHYILTFPYEEVDFIYCSTMNRPHKNIINLAKAIKIGVQDRYLPIKCVLSSYITYKDSVEPVGRYIEVHKLHNDILSINNAPSHIHACLYRLAALTVHPSPFEGSLPFTFSESLSVGTPVLMARGPAVEEFLTPAELNEFCFSPSSPDDLMNRAERIIADPKAYTARQLETLDRLKRRSWRDVAKDYATAVQAGIRSYESDAYSFQNAIGSRSVAASDFLGGPSRVNFSKTQTIADRYLAPDFVGSLRITCDVTMANPESIASLSFNFMRWTQDGLVEYPAQLMKVQQSRVGQMDRVIGEFELQESERGILKELRITWNGPDKGRLVNIEWGYAPLARWEKPVLVGKRTIGAIRERLKGRPRPAPKTK